MEQEEVITLLKDSGVVKLTSETRLGTFMTTNKSSLIAQQVSNRSSADWKKAQFIVINKSDSNNQISHDEFIEGWKSLAEDVQFLIVFEDGEWNCYNYFGNKVSLDEILSSKVSNNSSKNKYVKLLLAKKNLVLTGAPGTGKSYLAKSIAASLIGSCDWKSLSNQQKKQVGFVQFHPSYDYTDFVEGLRPNKNGSFERMDGIFKTFCKLALKNPDVPYVFIIDEINRGELSKILGELFYSIDPPYRGPEGTVTTQYNTLVEDDDVFKDGFFVPSNVYVIGTMNDVDRGVEAMDFAIRRRFGWVEITAEESADNMGITGLTRAKMRAVNDAMVADCRLTGAYQIGGAYFRNSNGDYDSLWTYNLDGLLREYFRGDPDIEEKMDLLKRAYDSAAVVTCTTGDSSVSSQSENESESQETEE